MPFFGYRYDRRSRRTGRRGATLVSCDSEGGTHVIRLAGGRTSYVVADRGRRPGNLDDQERKRRSCIAPCSLAVAREPSSGAERLRCE